MHFQARISPPGGVSRSVFTKRNPWSSRVIYFHARRGFARWREQYIPVRVRLAQKPNAAMASARRGFARWREQYIPVRERLAQKPNAAMASAAAQRAKKKAGFSAGLSRNRQL
jgi:hypothetical protein